MKKLFAIVAMMGLFVAQVNAQDVTPVTPVNTAASVKETPKPAVTPAKPAVTPAKETAQPAVTPAKPAPAPVKEAPKAATPAPAPVKEAPKAAAPAPAPVKEAPKAAPAPAKETPAAPAEAPVVNDSIPADSAAVDSAAVKAEEPVAEEAVAEGGIVGVHKGLKTKFIEGGPEFMALVSVALVIGLAFCIERIIYLSLANVNAKKLMGAIADALSKGDVEAAKDICRNTAGPVASICYQGLLRIDEGLDTVERSVVSYGSLQSAMLEKGCSWITLFIAMAPSLGFLGTVIGMVMAFDTIQREGDISPTIVAGGMKVALITTIYGIIVALILQVFYNFILTKIESIVADMEDSSITLLDLLTKYNLKK